MVRLPLCIAAWLALVGATVVRADDHPYAKVRVGDYATYAVQMKVGELTLQGTTTQTVTARTDKEVTVKITGKIQFMGNEQPIPPQEQKIDLTQPYDPTRFSGPLPMGAQVQVDKGKEGKEKVSLAGKSYNCTWTEYKVNTKAAGVAFEANVKVWMSPEVPLGMVKMSMTSNQGPQKMQMTMELKETGQNK